jgi:hypothetical protein
MNTTNDPPLVRIATDFNWREDYRTIVLPDRAPAEVLVPGTRIILYEPDAFECEAIVRRGETWPWVADIIEGTIKNYPCSEGASSDSNESS